MGMSRNINSVDFRPVKPYRAVAGSDEGVVCFFEGPPFTFKHSYSVRFFPSYAIHVLESQWFCECGTILS